MFLISLDWLYSNTQQDYNSREKHQFFQSYIHNWIDQSWYLSVWRIVVHKWRSNMLAAAPEKKHNQRSDMHIISFFPSLEVPHLRSVWTTLFEIFWFLGGPVWS